MSSMRVLRKEFLGGIWAFRFIFQGNFRMLRCFILFIKHGGDVDVLGMLCKFGDEQIVGMLFICHH